MDNIQIIVVSASEKRKQTLEKQFLELNITCPIHYIDGKALDMYGGDEYIDQSLFSEPISLIDRRTILSTRSHIHAVELASMDTSPEFTLIVEDDIAIHKTKFKSTLIEIISKFDTLITPHSHILSLGWIPCNHYSFYKDYKADYTLNDKYKILLRLTPGTQAYLIKRTIAKQFIPLFKHDTYGSLRDTILGLKNPLVTSEGQTIVFDDFGTKLLNQCILFPPIVIEQENTSLIRDTTENPYWKKFFTNYEDIRKEFWSF
jgi:GR25 family glycosyltransferase involved in LPS biosynthesis